MHKQFYQAIVAGNLALVQKFMAVRPALLNYHFAPGLTPLCIAIKCNHLHLTHFFLEQGAKLFLTPDLKVYPLLIAASFGHTKLLRLLMIYPYTEGHMSKALLNNQSAFDPTILLNEAAQKGHLETCHFLLEQGASVKKAQIDGYTPLLNAAANGHIHIVKLLLTHNAPINHSAQNQFTSLSLATYYHHEELVNYLLRKGAQVDGVALTVAVQKNNLNLITLFLKHGVSVYSELSNGKTPLSIALNEASLDVIKLFFKYGAEINKPCQGYPPLVIALFKNNQPLIAYLLEQGASITDSLHVYSHPSFFPNLIKALEKNTTITQITLPEAIPVDAAFAISNIMMRNSNIARLTVEALNCMHTLAIQISGMKQVEIDTALDEINDKTSKIVHLFPDAPQLQQIESAFIEMQLDVYLFNPDRYSIEQAIELFNSMSSENKVLPSNQHRLQSVLLHYFARLFSDESPANNRPDEFARLFLQLTNPDRDMNQLLIHYLGKHCNLYEHNEHGGVIHTLYYDLYKLWQKCDLKMLKRLFNEDDAVEIMLYLIEQLLRQERLNLNDYKKILNELIPLSQQYSNVKNDELLFLAFKGLCLIQDTSSALKIHNAVGFYDLLKISANKLLSGQYISEQEAKKRLCSRHLSLSDNSERNSCSNLGMFSNSSRDCQVACEEKQNVLTVSSGC